MLLILNKQINVDMYIDVKNIPNSLSEWWAYGIVFFSFPISIVSFPVINIQHRDREQASRHESILP